MDDGELLLELGVLGTVVGVQDGIPNGVPPNPPPDVTVQNAGGNYVVEDIGGGNFAFCAHLVPGSLEVKVGQRVRVETCSATSATPATPTRRTCISI